MSVSGAVCLCDQTIAPAPGPGTLGVWHKQSPASGPGTLDAPSGCNAAKRASPRCTQVSIGDSHPCQSCPPTFAAMSNSCSHRSWCALGKSPTPSFKKWSTRSAPPGAVGSLVGWRCGLSQLAPCLPLSRLHFGAVPRQGCRMREVAPALHLMSLYARWFASQPFAFA